MLDFDRIIGFDWDAGNSRKSADKHAVSQAESEQVFFNQLLLLVFDTKHSALEHRNHALGRTEERAYYEQSAQGHTNIRKRSTGKGILGTHNSTEFVDWSNATNVRLPNLKPTSTSISLRLRNTTLERIKIAANKRDVPYQSLIKTWLSEKIDDVQK